MENQNTCLKKQRNSEAIVSYSLKCIINVCIADLMSNRLLGIWTIGKIIRVAFETQGLNAVVNLILIVPIRDKH